MPIILLLVFLNILCFLGIVGLVVLFFYEAAKQKKQASFVKEGTMEFVMAGGRCIRVLENIKECYYKKEQSKYVTKVGKKFTPGQVKPDNTTCTEEEWLLIDRDVTVKESIVSGDPDTNSTSLGAWLRNKWGFFWVSLFYPARRIHKFFLIKARLREGMEGQSEKGTLSEWWIETEKEPQEVDHLLWRFPRPIVAASVEFADVFKANLGIIVQLQVVMPNLPVFVFEGKFFPPTESMIRSTVVDYARTMKMMDFITNHPTGPNSSFFAAIVSQLNPEMIKLYGIEITNAWIAEIQIIKDTRVQEALQAKELAEREGEAGITKKTKEGEALLAYAEREAKAITVVAQAQAGAFKIKLDAVGDKPQILQEQIRTDGLAGFKGQFLSLGATTPPGVVVGVEAKTEKKGNEEKGKKDKPQDEVKKTT